MVELPQRPGFKVCSNSLSPSIFCGTQLFYCVYWSCAFIRPRGSFLGVVPHFFWPKWPQAKSSNWTKMLIVINLCLLGCNCCDSLRWKMEKEKKSGWLSRSGPFSALRFSRSSEKCTRPQSVSFSWLFLWKCSRWFYKRTQKAIPHMSNSKPAGRKWSATSF